jgi:hypothetical protein
MAKSRKEGRKEGVPVDTGAVDGSTLRQISAASTVARSKEHATATGIGTAVGRTSASSPFSRLSGRDKTSFPAWSCSKDEKGGTTERGAAAWGLSSCAHAARKW